MMGRKLIHNSENKVSYLQIVGFLVILAGVVYLFIEQIFYELKGEIIAIDFFTIMMGMAFAFPELLRDSNKGLSTMRIVVFMMINVICILLLKIGWEQHSLKTMGLDQFWVAMIAFVFGAKATQSYFENRPAAPPPPPAPVPPPPTPVPPPPPPPGGIPPPHFPGMGPPPPFPGPSFHHCNDRG